jgi:hypothetical protein
VTIQKEGEKKKRIISVGHIKVRLPFYSQWIFLVVVKGFSEKPLMLLTNVNVRSLGVMRVFGDLSDAVEV